MFPNDSFFLNVEIVIEFNWASFDIFNKNMWEKRSLFLKKYQGVNFKLQKVSRVTNFWLKNIMVASGYFQHFFSDYKDMQDKKNIAHWFSINIMY